VPSARRVIVVGVVVADSDAIRCPGSRAHARDRGTVVGGRGGVRPLRRPGGRRRVV